MPLTNIRVGVPTIFFAYGTEEMTRLFPTTKGVRISFHYTKTELETGRLKVKILGDHRKSFPDTLGSYIFPHFNRKLTLQIIFPPMSDGSQEINILKDVNLIKLSHSISDNEAEVTKATFRFHKHNLEVADDFLRNGLIDHLNGQVELNEDNI